MILLDKRKLLYINSLLLFFLFSCNKTSSPPKQDYLNNKSIIPIKNNIPKSNIITTKTNKDTNNSIPEINNFSITNTITTHAGSKDSKNNKQSQSAKSNQINILEKIKQIIKEGNLNIDEIKQEYQNKYKKEIKNLSLPKRAKTNKEKKKLVEKAIELRRLKLILKVLGLENKIIPKTKSETQLLEEYALIGLAGVGPKESEETPEQIKDNNLALIQLDEIGPKELQVLEDKQNEWIENFIQVILPFLKQAKIWESYDVINNYKKFDKQPIISDEDYIKQKKNILDKIKLDIEINENVIKDENSFKIKINDDQSIIIPKLKFNTENKIENIIYNNKKAKLIKYKSQNTSESKQTLITTITALEKYNEIFNNDKQNLISSFKLNESFYAIIQKEEKAINEDLFNKIFKKYKLLQKLSFDEYDNLKDIGIKESPTIFNMNLPKKRLVNKTFKCIYKNAKGELKEKNYEKGKEISNKLVYNITETSLRLFEKIFIDEIKEAISNISQSLSQEEIQKTLLKDGKFILNKNILDEIQDKIIPPLSYKLKYFKLLRKTITPILFKQNPDNQSDNEQNLEENSNISILKTIGDLRTSIGITYQTPQEVIDDLLKLKSKN